MMLPGDREERGAVAVELAAADAGDVGQRRKGDRPAARHLYEGRIVEDHIRRQFLAARFIEAPGAQRRP